MTERVFNGWYNTSAVRDYICLQAQRHCNNEDDRSDFEQEAWARIFLLTSGCCVEQIHQEAYRAIHAAYERERRHRGHEIPFSRMT